ncbi:hypothetical protein SAMN04489723_101326 [Algoriphagus aquimarinus]|uniref:Uncharacterized protein n=1 Tax=Algoriphagus aquimarinus TaxID=237018 RepID=A0A1I0VQW3_9BACT|nr:hypothetical protein SAMN04489723_101326 [Algoriphagus aquimarinus]
MDIVLFKLCVNVTFLVSVLNNYYNTVIKNIIALIHRNQYLILNECSIKFCTFN